MKCPLQIISSGDLVILLATVGGVVGLLGVPPPSVFPPHSQNQKPSHLSHLTGGRISWWKDVAEPPDAWRQLTNAAAAKTAQRRYERL